MCNTIMRYGHSLQFLIHYRIRVSETKGTMRYGHSPLITENNNPFKTLSPKIRMIKSIKEFHEIELGNGRYGGREFDRSTASDRLLDWTLLYAIPETIGIIPNISNYIYKSYYSKSLEREVNKSNQPSRSES